MMQSIRVRVVSLIGGLMLASIAHASAISMIPLSTVINDLNLGVDFANISPMPTLPFIENNLLTVIQPVPNNSITFSERFNGQNLSYADLAGNPIPPSTSQPIFDVLSSSASNPLVLTTGLPGQNLALLSSSDAGNPVQLAGMGPQGVPGPNGKGEGSVAVLFEQNQSALAFEIFGTNPGQGQAQTFIDFFGRDGSLLDMVTLTNQTNGYVAFETVSGAREIAGLSIYTNDNGGLGYNNFLYSAVPEPSTISLLYLGLAGFGLFGKKRKA